MARPLHCWLATDGNPANGQPRENQAMSKTVTVTFHVNPSHAKKDPSKVILEGTLGYVVIDGVPCRIYASADGDGSRVTFYPVKGSAFPESVPSRPVANATPVQPTKRKAAKKDLSTPATPAPPAATPPATNPLDAIAAALAAMNARLDKAGI